MQVNERTFLLIPEEGKPYFMILEQTTCEEVVILPMNSHTILSVKRALMVAVRGVYGRPVVMLLEESLTPGEEGTETDLPIHGDFWLTPIVFDDHPSMIGRSRSMISFKLRSAGSIGPYQCFQCNATVSQPGELCGSCQGVILDLQPRIF